MKKASTLTLSVAALTLAGCASWFPTPEAPEEEAEVELPERGMRYGVSYVKPESDIVIMESSYQHVVLPSGAVVSYRDDWEADALVGVAQQLDEAVTDEAAPSGSTDDQTEASPADSGALRDEAEPGSPSAPETDQAQARRLSAWRKLCEDRLDEMSDGDYFLVQTTDMPEALADECDERAALGRLK